MKKTNLFIVLNEETLNTMKGKHGKTARFATKEEADEVASHKLNMWVVVPINFEHEFLNHVV